MYDNDNSILDGIWNERADDGTLRCPFCEGKYLNMEQLNIHLTNRCNEMWIDGKPSFSIAAASIQELSSCSILLPFWSCATFPHQIKKPVNTTPKHQDLLTNIKAILILGPSYNSIGAWFNCQKYDIPISEILKTYKSELLKLM